MAQSYLDGLVRRHRTEGGLEKSILEAIARNVYGDPDRYGFRQEDEVGEAFSRYWARIVALIDNYEESATGFEAYLTSAFRYFALSIRRDRAIQYDRENVIGMEEALSEREVGSADAEEDECVDLSAWKKLGSETAFRKRIGYLCAKCAHLLDDERVAMIARAVGLPPEALVRMVRAVRERTTIERKRFMSRRRGRDAAWLRMNINERRLYRQPDPAARRELSGRIDRDRRLYRYAVATMRRSRSALSNRVVAGILGESKATVDSGVTRILRQFRSLYQAGPELIE